MLGPGRRAPYMFRTLEEFRRRDRKHAASVKLWDFCHIEVNKLYAAKSREWVKGWAIESARLASRESSASATSRRYVLIGLAFIANEAPDMACVKNFSSVVSHRITPLLLLCSVSTVKPPIHVFRVYVAWCTESAMGHTSPA